VAGSRFMKKSSVPFVAIRMSPKRSESMQIRVDCYAGHRGEETPRRVHFDRRCIEVADVLDRWLAHEYRYFKVLGSDDAIYILRHDVSADAWDLTMYQSAPAQNTQRSP